MSFIEDRLREFFPSDPKAPVLILSIAKVLVDSDAIDARSTVRLVMAVVRHYHSKAGQNDVIRLAVAANRGQFDADPERLRRLITALAERAPSAGA